MRIGLMRSGGFDAGAGQVESETRVQRVRSAVYGLVHLRWKYTISSQIVQVVTKPHIVGCRGSLV